MKLAMLDIDKQLPNRGSISSAHTSVASTGLLEAQRDTWESVRAAWLRRAGKGGSYAEALEGLDPVALGGAVLALMAGIPELKTPDTSDMDELAKRAGTLNDLHADRLPKVRRAVEGAAATVLDERLLRLTTALDRVFAESPFDLGGVVGSVGRWAAALVILAADEAPLMRYQRYAAKLRELPAMRDRLPAKTFENVGKRLAQACLDAYRMALAETAQRAASDALRVRLARLADRLKDRSARASALVQLAQQVRATYEDRLRTANVDVEATRATCVLLLPGPTSNEVQAVVRRHYQSGTLDDLGEKLLSLLEVRLRRVALAENPAVAEDDPLPTVFLALTAPRIADELGRLVEEGATGFSLYELLERYGVQEAALFLWARGDVTCDLGGRENERFGVAPLRHAIVRLPAPSGPRDPEIQRVLATAFQTIAGPQACAIKLDDEGERDVVVVRLNVGWPIGLEEENSNLLTRYVRSGEMRHYPHLLGIVHDAPSGELSPAYSAVFVGLGDGGVK